MIRPSKGYTSFTLKKSSLTLKNSDFVKIEKEMKEVKNNPLLITFDSRAVDKKSGEGRYPSPDSGLIWLR